MRTQLLSEGLELEAFGGDVQCVETAAPTGAGLAALEEALLLQAEVMELSARADVRRAGGRKSLHTPCLNTPPPPTTTHTQTKPSCPAKHPARPLSPQKQKTSRAARAEGVVVEAHLDRGLGPVATLILRRGTLRPGDAVLAGTEHGKVRQLRDSVGAPLEYVSPGAFVWTNLFCLGCALVAALPPVHTLSPPAAEARHPQPVAGAAPLPIR